MFIIVRALVGCLCTGPPYPKRDRREEENRRMPTEETCPVCDTILSGTTTGVYAIDGVLRTLCITCVREKQEEMKKKIVLWTILGGAIGAAIFIFMSLLW